MEERRFALKRIVPITFAYLFVGIAFGVMMSEAGYSPIWSLFAGIFIYAGSMQIVMVPLLVAGVPLYIIGIMTFLINARHLFYGIGFVEKFRKMGKKYPYMVLTLTDEVYSILCLNDYPDDVNEQKTDFYIALFCHLLWIFSCILGALIGEFIPFDMKGIEFSATAFFLVVCVNQWETYKTKIPAITGLICAVVFLIILGPEKFLLPALSVSLFILILLKNKINLFIQEEGA